MKKNPKMFYLPGLCQNFSKSIFETEIRAQIIFYYIGIIFRQLLFVPIEKLNTSSIR